MSYLQEKAASFGLNLSDTQCSALNQLISQLLEFNSHTNLTAIRTVDECVDKHILDSLSIAPYLKGESLIDVGTGAGFPGLPLRIVLPKLRLCLLDSQLKRVNYLSHVTSFLNLNGVSVVHGRAEDYGKNPQYRQCFHTATARAVASLPVLCELCLPFLMVGGVFLAMKGSLDTHELQLGKRVAPILGCELTNVYDVNVPNCERRTIVEFTKTRPTPTQYPRKAGTPQKKPLCL